MTYDDLTPMQRAMFVQAVMNWVGKEAKTEGNGGDGARAEADRDARELYESTGATSFSVKLGDVELGKYSVVVSKPVPGSTATVFDLKDGDEFAAWLDTEDGKEMACLFANSRGEAFAAWCAEQGVMPGGVEPREVVTPAKPAAYKGTRIAVSKGLAERIESRAIAGLLDG